MNPSVYLWAAMVFFYFIIPNSYAQDQTTVAPMTVKEGVYRNIPGSQPKLRYFTQKPDVPGSATPYGNNLVAGHYVQSGDARLYYEVYGKGSPILVMHGGGVGTPYELGSIIDKLRGNHQVIVMSTRGHGRSEIGKSPLSFAQRADDAYQVLRAVTEQPAMVIGFSDGAYASYALATKYPQAVDRIVAIGAGTLTPGYYHADMTWEDLRNMDPEFIAQEEKLAPEPARLPAFFHDYMMFWSKVKVGADELSHITCPVLLIAGDEDDHAPMVTMVQAENLIPNSRLCIVPKAGHTAFLDNEAVVWDAVGPFLEADKATLVPSRKVLYNQHFLPSDSQK